ncbi:hypothetical protein N7539_001222 [Penicillium diatomitis]|uniref:DUF7703 domain-containing protein n=1 Tax=Penicillium diatomitis TaxID=2819901 RepID=A0A9X0C335_9EURO|nr:uncharacterized protein N7539_001222 [Penicillium diatomitis]KAJ5496106.1 hypothetical protein N7539_001222 [Penicillium diatomitis]
MVGHNASVDNSTYTERSIDSFTERTILACLIGIAWYNALELIVLCFSTFKRYGGCYFWSLLVASFSVIPYGLGYLLIIFRIFPNEFSVAMELIAWVGMVTGQSLVLWSRLHLVVHSRRVLRACLAMIIIDAILFHLPAAVLEFGAHTHKADLFVPPFNVFERIQLIAFSLQEIVLSALYSYEAVRLLNLRPRGHYRGTLLQLLIVNLAMIFMDAAIIGVQYSGYFDVHVTLKAMSYSIKLKLEYAILGKLVHFTEMSHSTNSAPTDLSDFVDLSYYHPNQPRVPDGGSQTRFVGGPDSPYERCGQTPSKESSHDAGTSEASTRVSTSNEAVQRSL